MLVAASAPNAGGKIYDGETEIVVSSGAVTEFKPDDADIDGVISNFDKFLNLRDYAPDQAFDFLTAGNRQKLNQADWVAAHRQNIDKFGPDVARQVSRMTWYPNPPNVPSGVYVAVDFAAKTGQNAFRCGYIVLVGSKTAMTQIARVDETYIPAELLDGNLPNAKVLPQLPCYLGPNIATAFPKATP